MQFAQDMHHFEAALAVERAGGFVREDDLAAVHQRAGDAHTLLLTAGHLRRTMREMPAEPEPFEQGGGARRALRLRGAGVHGGHFHIALRREMPHQVIALEDEAEVLATQFRQRVVAERSHVVAVDLVTAGARAVQTAEHVHQRRLARAGRPHDRDHLAAPDLQFDVAQDRHRARTVAERARDAAKPQQRGGARHSTAPASFAPVAGASVGSAVTTRSPSDSPSSACAVRRLSRPTFTQRTWALPRSSSTRTR